MADGTIHVLLILFKFFIVFVLFNTIVFSFLSSFSLQFLLHFPFSSCEQIAIFSVSFRYENNAGIKLCSQNCDVLNLMGLLKMGVTLGE